jgi:hypothetical protein
MLKWFPELDSHAVSSVSGPQKSAMLRICGGLRKKNKNKKVVKIAHLEITASES